MNEEAYRPWVVSIGPVYYHDSRLLPMQEQKLRYLQSFLRRSNAYNLDGYTKVIRGWEEIARQYYVDIVSLSSEVFVEMLLIDATFVIELFLRGSNEFIDENDRIFNKPRMVVEVTRDIRVEENQLPFFILKGLYDLAFSPTSHSDYTSFVDIAYRFLTSKEIVIPERVSTSDIKHLVDFLRTCYLPSTLREQQQPKSNQLGFKLSPSVTKLSEAGVEFVASKSENFLDITFHKGVLEIPRLLVTVFEQCHYYFDSYIIDYFAFLDSLINTPKDVAILVQHGIIDNWLGNNEEVANLFNKIFKRTRLRGANFYYSRVCQDLNAYASTSWHRWRTILKHDYFNHPWAIISVIYAVVILVLTVLQTLSGFTSKK